MLICSIREAGECRTHHGRDAVLCVWPSDKKISPRADHSALTGDLVKTAGADRFMTLDLHADNPGFFSIPVTK